MGPNIFNASRQRGRDGLERTPHPKPTCRPDVIESWKLILSFYVYYDCACVYIVLCEAYLLIIVSEIDVTSKQLCNL